VNVAKYKKGVYYLGVKVFIALPFDIKTEFNNPKKFKVVLQKFLYKKSFYSLDEYFNLYCAGNSNIVQNFVIVVHFCNGLTA
jgi:hypothetical protein